VTVLARRCWFAMQSLAKFAGVLEEFVDGVRQDRALAACAAVREPAAEPGPASAGTAGGVAGGADGGAAYAADAARARAELKRLRDKCEEQAAALELLRGKHAVVQAQLTGS
jgi:hypothetical protein